MQSSFSISGFGPPSPTGARDALPVAEDRASSAETSESFILLQKRIDSERFP